MAADSPQPATPSQATDQDYKEITIGGSSRAHLGNVYNNNTYHGPPERAETLPAPSSNVPFRRDPDFIERGDLLQRIGAKVSQPAARVALVGLGGIGKSQLAIEYCSRLRAESPDTWVLWIYAGNLARYEQGVRDIVDLVKARGRDDPKADIFKLFRNWLRDSKKGRWVLVLDNVDDASFLLDVPSTNQESAETGSASEALYQWLPVCDHGSMLVTTRSEDVAKRLVERSDMIPIYPMDKEDATALLTKKLEQPESQTDITELAEALDYMPLAITQAAAYLNRMGSRSSIRKYLDRLQKMEKSKKNVLEDDAGDLRRDRDARNSILRTWHISFEQIHKSSRSASELLSLMSFCDRQSIPEALIRTRESNDTMHEQSGDATSSVGKLPPDVSNSDGEDSSPESASSEDLNHAFDEDIKILEGYSFVSTTTDPSIFQMHRLVQAATRRWLELHGEFERWMEQFISNLLALFPFPEYDNWATCQVFHPHAKAAVQLKPKRHEALLGWATLMHRAAHYSLHVSVAGDVEEMAVTSMKARAKELGDNDVETLQSKELVALVRVRMGQWEEAEKLRREILETQESTLGEGHPDTMVSAANLASTYQLRGRWKEAESLRLRVIEGRKAQLGIDHPHTQRSMTNLAFTYRNQKRWEEALELERQVIEAQKGDFRVVNPYMLCGMFNLALLHRSQGREKEAEELELNIKRACEDTISKGIPDALPAVENLALAYQNHGYLKEAEELYKQVLQTVQRIRGADHPDTLTCSVALGVTYFKQARWEEAEEQLVHVLEVRNAIHGADHPATLACTSDLALIYNCQGRWKEAEQLDLQAMESRKRLLGMEHPHTLISLGNLATTYANQGRFKEAEDLNSQALRLRTAVMGPTHPDTLENKSNLAKNFWSQGRYKEAEELYAQTVEGRKVVLGPEHPETLKTIADLTIAQNAQKDEERPCAPIDDDRDQTES